MLQAMRHDCEASRLVGELGSVVGSMGDQHPSKDFAAVDNDFRVLLSKEVQQPLA